MSNRIAVFNHGAVRQVGPPRELYDKPADAFVAGFVGVSNLIEQGGRKFLLRPEKIDLYAAEPALGPGFRCESGIMRERHYLGMTMRYLVSLDRGETLTVAAMNGRASGAAPPERSERVWVAWRPEDTVEITEGGMK